MALESRFESNATKTPGAHATSQASGTSTLIATPAMDAAGRASSRTPLTTGATAQEACGAGRHQPGPARQRDRHHVERQSHRVGARAGFADLLDQPFDLPGVEVDEISKFDAGLRRRSRKPPSSSARAVSHWPARDRPTYSV